MFAEAMLYFERLNYWNTCCISPNRAQVGVLLECEMPLVSVHIDSLTLKGLGGAHCRWGGRILSPIDGLLICAESLLFIAAVSFFPPNAENRVVYRWKSAGMWNMAR